MAPQALGTGLLVARRWGHGPGAGTGWREEEKPPFPAMHLTPWRGNRTGQAESFRPPLPGKALGKGDICKERAGDASASPRYLIAAKLGEGQPGTPAPASKTFRPAAELETLFVFLPGQPATSLRWQLLRRAGDENRLGSEPAPRHPHPPPALRNGSQWWEPPQPGAPKLEPNYTVQRRERTLRSCTALLLHPIPKIPPPIAPMAPQAALGKDHHASWSSGFAARVKTRSHSPPVPHAARVEGRTRPPQSRRRGDAAPGGAGTTRRAPAVPVTRRGWSSFHGSVH